MTRSNKFIRIEVNKSKTSKCVMLTSLTLGMETRKQYSHRLVLDVLSNRGAKMVEVYKTVEQDRK